MLLAQRVLRIVYSADPAAVGRCFPLDGRAYAIGRGADSDESIDDSQMSRRHVRIFPNSEPDAYFVEDAGSQNGTYLDGFSLQRDRPAQLRAGQVLSTGNTLFVVDQEPERENLPAAPDADGSDVHEVSGGSFFSERLRQSISHVARASGAVLLLGPPGVGKEVTAHALHRLGSTPRAPLCIRNCAAIPPALAESELFGHEKNAFTDAKEAHRGLFEQADGGTVFLDEIGELPPGLQAKLLRVLEHGTIQPLRGKPRQVSVRVIAATNARIDLEAANFRQDLLSRLQWTLRLKPLSERRADILPLFRRFSLQKSGSSRSFTAEFAEALLLHGWPTNVRDLKHHAERLCSTYPGDTVLDLIHLDAPLQRPIRERRPLPEPSPASSAPNKRALSKEELEQTLLDNRGCVAPAARELGAHPTQLRRDIRKHGIDLDAIRRACAWSPSASSDDEDEDGDR